MSDYLQRRGNSIYYKFMIKIKNKLYSNSRIYEEESKYIYNNHLFIVLGSIKRA